MQNFIGSVLEIDQAEVIALTAQMSAPRKSQVARALIELNAMTVEVVDTVDDLLQAIELATHSRNVIAHSSFVRHPETGQIFSLREKARGSLQVTLTPMTKDEIVRDANAIYQAGMQLLQFMAVRKLYPKPRTRPIREPLDRREKARRERKGPIAATASEASDKLGG